MSTLLNKFQKLLKDKRGMTMFSLFLIIIVIIFLTIIFTNPDFIKKINRGRTTTAWSNELASLSNSVLSLNNPSDLLYPVRIKEPNTAFDILVPSPSLSAYNAVKTYNILKDTSADRNLNFTYDSESFATLGGETNAGTAIGVGSYNMTTPSGVAQDTTAPKINLLGISNSGSDGMVSFVNLSIPNVEESLLLGLMNQSGTQLGGDFSNQGVLNLDPRKDINPAMCSYIDFNSTYELIDTTNNGCDGPNSKTSIEVFLTMVFGGGITKDYNLSRQTSWVNMKLIDTKTLKDRVGGNYRFYNKDKYNLFWVESVAPKADAIRMFTSFFDITEPQAKLYSSKGCANAPCTTDELTVAELDIASQIYDLAMSYIQPDSIIVVPTTKSDSVYSSTSDFNLYKFTTTD